MLGAARSSVIAAFARGARCRSVAAIRRRAAGLPWAGDRDCVCCWACHRPGDRSCSLASDCASGCRATLAVAVRRAVTGLRRHLGVVSNCSREGASDVTDAQASECWGRGRDYLRDGSMVPGGSMMPLAKPPFDMTCIGCCTCTEYIQAAQEQPSSKEASVERREAQRGANGRGAVSRAGRTGIRSGRWGSCVGE
jgi:hypothetical protein